jgi:uncharacterized protein (TIGR03083 family)
MDEQIGLTAPDVVMVVDLFPEILAGLLELLSALDAPDWQKPTACSGWSVKDVALHLLGVEISNLSSRRDGHAGGASLQGWSELVAFLNTWNESWVEQARRISTPLLVDLLRFTGGQMNDYFRTLDPFAQGGSVAWAGQGPAPVWLDLAREYMERWHHQQHLRDAVGQPGFKEPRYLAPVLATFVRALPRTFETVQSAPGTSVTLTISGPSGGSWSILRLEENWKLFSGAPANPTAEIILAEESAWRLFTHGLTPHQARHAAVIIGEQKLGLQVLEMVAIIS